MWNTILDRMLRRLILIGTLDVIWPDGSASAMAAAAAPMAEVAVSRRRTIREADA